MQNSLINQLEIEFLEGLIFEMLDDKRSSKKSIKNNLKKILKRGKNQW